MWKPLWRVTLLYNGVVGLTCVSSNELGTLLYNGVSTETVVELARHGQGRVRSVCSGHSTLTPAVVGGARDPGAAGGAGRSLRSVCSVRKVK